MKYEFQETEQRAQRIAYLIIGFIKRTLTTREHDELDEWLEESDDNVELFAQLTDERNRDEAMTFMRNFYNDKTNEKRQSRQLLMVQLVKKAFSRFWQRISAGK